MVGWKWPTIFYALGTCLRFGVLKIVYSISKKLHKLTSFKKVKYNLLILTTHHKEVFTN